MSPAPIHRFSPRALQLLSGRAAACLALALAGALAWWVFGARAASATQPAPRSCVARLADERAFNAENARAMHKMMAGMSVKPTGDIDRDFVAMMVPHHQGAIDMAVAVLRYGHNPQIRRLAQEIIVDQQEEIAAMRLAVGEPLPPAAPAPTTAAPADQPITGMDMK